MTDLSFEIRDCGDLIRIEPIGKFDAAAKIQKEADWIEATVTIKSGSFGGSFNAYFMATDFELFRQEIKHLDNDFNGIARLEPIEEQLSIKISGDGLGHFEVNGFAKDRPGNGATLSFEMSFDQTEISRLVIELGNIIKAYSTK